MTSLGLCDDGRLCWRCSGSLCWLVRCGSWDALSMVPGAWSVSWNYADGRSFGLIVGVLSILCSLAVPALRIYEKLRLRTKVLWMRQENIGCVRGRACI